MSSKLRPELEKMLKKKYEPSAMIEVRFKDKDISIKTDDAGNAILLFIGKRNEAGVVKGERYARTLKTNSEGAVIKDHWELKGKAT